jgi:hypothetical protein
MSYEFYAVTYENSITIPGDERSRTNPGHGYPEHTVTNEVFKRFASEDLLKDWINRRRPYEGPYKVYLCKSVTVKTEVVTSISLE